MSDYKKLLEEHLRAINPGPGVHQVEVQHDGTCRLLRGAGACNCSPTVVSRGKKRYKPRRRGQR